MSLVQIHNWHIVSFDFGAEIKLFVVCRASLLKQCLVKQKLLGYSNFVSM